MSEFKSLTPITYAVPKIKVQDNQNVSPIDITEYSPYLPHGVFISHALDRSRAVAQSDGEQLWNATKTLPQAIGATLIGDAGSLLDFEDMNNQDDEIGSDLKRWSMNYVDKLHEDNPIYRENPGASFDFGDSAYFYEHGRGLAESIGAFMLEGMALGAGVGALFAKGAQAIKFGTVLAKTGNVAKASRLAKVLTGVESGVVQGMSGLTSSVLLNKIESDGAGIGVFDATYKTLIDAGVKETVARKRAADAGEHTILMNRANILLNVSSAMRFIKPINSTNNILKKINWKTNLTGLAVESGQEFLEEEINYLAEQSGLAKGKDKEYGFNEMLDDAMSDKGLESGVLGAIGGFMQQGGTQLKDMVSSNKRKIGTLNSETGLYMSNKAYNNMRYDQQETLRVKANKIFSDTGAAPAMESVFRNAKATIENNKILNDLTAQKEQFIKEGKKSEADAISLQIQEKVQEHLAFTAFEHFRAGSTSDLISVFEKVEKGESPAMAEKDPSSPEFYKTKAKEAITLIKKLENAYIESQSFKNSQSVYARKAFQIIKGTTLESVKKEREIHRIKLQEKLDKVKPGVSVAQIEAASVSGNNPNPNPNATQEEMDERAVLLNNRAMLDPTLQEEYDKKILESDDEIKNATDDDLNQKYKDSEKILNDLEKELFNEKFQSRKKGETSLSKEFLDSQNFVKKVQKKIQENIEKEILKRENNKLYPNSSEKSNEGNDAKGKKSISSKEIERKDESLTGISEITEVQTLLDLNDEIEKKENEKAEEQAALDLETSRENQIALAEQEKKDDEKFAKDIAKVDSVQQLINILDVEKSVNSLSSERETIIKKRIAVLRRKATILEKEAKERKEKDKEKERLLLGDENPIESLTDEITTSKDKTSLVNLIAPEGVKPVTTDQTKTSEVRTSNANGKAVEQSLKEQSIAESNNTQQDNSVLENKKAEIERRRQEELTKIIQSIFPNTKLNEIVYHGTRTQDKFDAFDETKIGELDSGYFGRGFYFSPDKSYAEGYSKQYNGYTIAAILNLQNPLETDANKANTNISLKNNDGAIVRVGENLNPELNTTEYDANEIGEVVVKNSNQIHILSEKELSNIDKINAKYDAELADFDSKQSIKKTNKKEEIIVEEDLTYENTPIEIQEDLGGYPTQHGVVQYVDHLDRDFGRTSAVANTDTSIGEYMADYSINKVGVKIKFVAFNYSENRELSKEEIAAGDHRKIDVKMVYLNSVGEPLMYNDKPVFGWLLKKLEKDTETESAIALQNRKTLIAMLSQGKKVFTQVTKVSQGKIGYFKNGESFNPKELFGEGELLVQNNVGELVNSKVSTPNPKGRFFKYNGEDVFIKLKRFNKGVVNFVSPKIMRSNGEPHNLRMNVAKVGQHGFDLLMARLTAQAKGIKPNDSTAASKNMLQNVGISGLTLAQATDLFFYKSNRISKNAINIQYINNKLWISYNETINGVTEYVTRDFAEELHFSESKNPNANVFNNFKLSIQNMYRSFNIEMTGKTFKKLGYEIPFTITNDLGTKTYKPSDTYDSFMFDQGILTTNVQSKVVNGKRIISFDAKTEFNTNPNDWDVKDSVKVEKLKDNDFESFESELDLPESAFEYIENPTLEKLDEETFEPETKITNFFDLIKPLTVFNTESENTEKVLSQSDVDNFTLEDAQNKASELFDTNLYKAIFDDMFIEQKESIFTSTKEQLIKIIKKICL